MSSKYTYTLAEASELTGIQEQALRHMAKHKLLNFAVAVPPREGSSTWRYMVDKQALDQCLDGKRDLFVIGG